MVKRNVELSQARASSAYWSWHIAALALSLPQRKGPEFKGWHTFSKEPLFLSPHALHQPLGGSCPASHSSSPHVAPASLPNLQWKPEPTGSCSRVLLDKAAQCVPVEMNLPKSQPAGQLTGALWQGFVFLIHHQQEIKRAIYPSFLLCHKPFSLSHKPLYLMPSEWPQYTLF